MRRRLRLAVPALVLAGSVAPAVAQQGSIQVSGSAHTLTGDAGRVGDQARFEPDAGVSWFQPGSRIGIFQLEVRGTKRGKEAHLGKAFAAWRDVKLGGLTWTFEAGDLYFTPVIGDYKFANLPTPAITFEGGTVSARSSRTSAGVVVGRVTAWRNIFGTDPDALGQDVALARAAHKPLDWLEVNARASRIRTANVREFSFTIAASDQAGAGARVTAGPLQFVADGGIVSYRRAGSAERHRDASLMAGASLLLARGWLQVNGSRFSPGEFPLLNYPLTDRQTAFAAGEYDVSKHVRVFGGWERFRSNLDPERSGVGEIPQPESIGDRGFGGLRLRIGGRNSIAFRVEDGDRRSYRFADDGILQSDTGVISAELQSRAGWLTSFLRLSHRQHEATDGAGNYTQDDGTAQVFASVSRRVQLFGTAAATRNHIDAGGGSTFYQFGGGGQVQIPNRNVWFRVEGLAARNLDLFTQNLVARSSLDLGVNGQVARNTTVGLNVHADHLPPGSTVQRPWVTRSILRVTRSFPTGSVRVNGATAGAAAVTRARGTGSVGGTVFEDWDADGVADADERTLEGIPVLLGTAGSTVSSARGEFAFVNVPVGLQRVGLDVSALPVDFDAPPITSIQIELLRDETRRVMFGLVPLGSVGGRVLRDANGNGRLDDGDEVLDVGVVVLDGGARSEQLRKGRFRFEAVRSGSHTIDLLSESLPEGAAIVGERSVAVSLTKLQPNPSVDFLIRLEKRPEIRKVFPPRGGGASSSTPAATTRTPPQPATSSASGTPRVRPTAAAAAAPAAARRFTIQIAALSDASRAAALAGELKAAGFPAYLEPEAAESPWHRVRVGRYATRAAVEKVLLRLEKRLGEKLWVIRER
jgi:hypothetical protein